MNAWTVLKNGSQRWYKEYHVSAQIKGIFFIEVFSTISVKLCIPLFSLTVVEVKTINRVLMNYC